MSSVRQSASVLLILVAFAHSLGCSDSDGSPSTTGGVGETAAGGPSGGSGGKVDALGGSNAGELGGAFAGSSTGGSLTSEGGAGAGGMSGSAASNGTGFGGASAGSTSPSTFERRLALGNEHGCAIGHDSSLVCWGTPSHDLGQTRGPDGAFRHISAKLASACGVAMDQSIQCWGSNDGGLQAPPSRKFLQMDVGVGASCGYTHTCLRSDGSVACWGSNSGDRATPPAGPL